MTFLKGKDQKTITKQKHVASWTHFGLTGLAHVQHFFWLCVRRLTLEYQNDTDDLLQEGLNEKWVNRERRGRNFGVISCWYVSAGTSPDRQSPWTFMGLYEYLLRCRNTELRWKTGLNGLEVYSVQCWMFCILRARWDDNYSAKISGIFKTQHKRSTSRKCLYGEKNDSKCSKRKQDVW